MNTKTITATLLFALAIASAFALFAAEDGSAENEYDFYDEYGFGYNIIEGTNNVIFYPGNYDFEDVTVLDESKGFRSAVTHNGKTYTVTEIGPSAFLTCYNLKEIVIPDTVTVIHNHAFANTGLTNVNMENIVSIGSDAFYQSSLFEGKKFPIGKNLADIQPESFYSSGITGFEISPENEYYVIIDDALCTKDMKSLLYFCGTAEKWTDGYTTPDVEIIENRSFFQCPVEGTLTISPSVKKIGVYAFQYNKFSEVKFSENGNLEAIETCAFGYSDGLGTLEFPDSLKVIGDTAFYMTGVEKIVFNDGLLYIGDASFSGCGISSIDFGNTVRFIGTDAFSFNFNYTSNAELEFPSTLEVIGSSAFYYCPGLDGGKITFNSQPVIGHRSFGIGDELSLTVEGLDIDTNFLYTSMKFDANSCAKVSNFDYETVDVLDPENGFNGVSWDGKTAVLFASGDKTGENIVFSNFMNDVNGKSYPVVGIFSNSELIADKITIPDSVKIIACDHDGEKINTKHLVFAPNSKIEMIAEYTFKESSLEGDIKIPESNIYIEQFSFSGTRISSIDTGGTRYIGSNSLHGNSENSMKKLTLGPNTEYLGTYCLGMNQLTELTIPENVKIVSSSAFAGNDQMKKMTFEGEPIIGNLALSLDRNNRVSVEIVTPGWNPSELGPRVFGDLTTISKWTDSSKGQFNLWWLILVMVVIAAGLVYWGSKNN